VGLWLRFGGASDSLPRDTGYVILGVCLTVTILNTFIRHNKQTLKDEKVKK